MSNFNVLVINLLENSVNINHAREFQQSIPSLGSEMGQVFHITKIYTNTHIKY